MPPSRRNSTQGDLFNGFPAAPPDSPTSRSGASAPVTTTEPLEPPEHAPLAERMRPRTLDDLAGQTELLGPGTLLRRLVERRQPLSLIFWGPPGTGKTTLARILLSSWDLPGRFLSAVTSGIQDARQVFAEARETQRRTGRRTVVFVDEIHRFNRTQQDAFLPYVEAGTIVLIGATTENPSFSVVAPLLSRCRVLVLRPLRPDEMRQLLERAAADEPHGLGSLSLRIEEDAMEALVWGSGGDARRGLNCLEAAAEGALPEEDGTRRIPRDLVVEALGKRYTPAERGGETAFNLLSALHKSLRGGDPDAAVYWLVRIIECGEDPLVAARRMVAMAAEDVGCADPRALPLAVSALQAYQALGSPEGDLALTEAAVYLACAPKSNAAAKALWAAREAVAQHGSLPVPVHLRNAVTPLMRQLGYGREYLYPHDFPDGQVEQQYLPTALLGSRFYVPTDRGFEGALERRRLAPPADPQGGSR